MTRSTRRRVKLRSARPLVESLEVRAVPAILPTGFAEFTAATGLTRATSLALSPDGKLFITEQSGSIQIHQAGTRLQANFFRDTPLTVDASGERGLLGIAFDPNYLNNRFVYVYYTATSPAAHNRISRFTANNAGERALPGSETIIMELDNLSSLTIHNGGAIHFGQDQMLYVATGDNANGANAQSLENLFGKMLRIHPDGSIPSDNPFANTATGKNRAIWALGLRNPFTFAIQRATDRIFVNDVGENAWEEIDDGSPSANFGWPETEGSTADPRFTPPLSAYDHTQGQAISGGDFYNPITPQFPSDFLGDYLYADYVAGWIRRLNPATGAVAEFATGVSHPVDLDVGADGALYYLARVSNQDGAGQVIQVRYTSPSIIVSDVVLKEGNTGTVNAVFTISLSGVSEQPITVRYTTIDGTATAPDDYIAIAQTLVTFAPGERSKQVAVAVRDDTIDEPDETFELLLTDATGAAIADARGKCAILDNDPAPKLIIADLAVWELNTGQSLAQVKVSLNKASAKTISVNYTTADGTAVANLDFVPNVGTLVFAPGETVKYVPVAIIGDSTTEPDEFLALNFNTAANATLPDPQAIITIQNDDLSVKVGDVSRAEGNTGATAFTFNLTLVGDSPSRNFEVSLLYKTADGTALAGSDYTALPSTSVVFAPGESTKLITVLVLGDTIVEPNKKFKLMLSKSTNARITRATATGTILNDD
jgi:glucose/arabinose dehydrogenase